jgi:uncharacterized membrane protein
MSWKRFTLMRIFIVIIMAGLVNWAVVYGNALVPIP